MKNKFLTRLYVFVWTFLPLHAFAQEGPGAMSSESSSIMGGIMDCGSGMGIMMLFPVLIMSLLVVLLVLGTVLLVKSLRKC